MSCYRLWMHAAMRECAVGLDACSHAEGGVVITLQTPFFYIFAFKLVKWMLIYVQFWLIGLISHYNIVWFLKQQQKYISTFTLIIFLWNVALFHSYAYKFILYEPIKQYILIQTLDSKVGLVLFHPFIAGTVFRRVSRLQNLTSKDGPDALKIRTFTMAVDP